MFNSFRCFLLALLVVTGCKGYQYARVVKPGEREMVGSHQAGGETFRPLVEESVAKLLSRVSPGQQTQFTSYGENPGGKMHICFVGVENKSSEEIGDFKEQIFEAIDAKLLESDTFAPISRRYVEAGLRETRLRPDSLFIPDNMRMFAGMMESQGQPFDYLLFAKITSGTTRENSEYQRDYQLTLDLVDVHSGMQLKETATLSKGYHQSAFSRWRASNFNLWR